MARLFLVMLVWSVALVAVPAQAALSFSLRTGVNATGAQNMPVDSNQCPAAGPTTAYVGGVITNTGASTETNVQATLAGLSNGFYLAGGQPAAQQLGALAPGASATVFWLVGYGCTPGAMAAPTVAMTSAATSANRTLSLAAYSSISANAGGNVLSATLGAGAVVGQTIYFDTAYDFGGTAVGDQYYLQPAGSAAFNAACFRMVGSRIMASNLAAIPVGTVNQLYFVQPSKQPGNNYFATVRYYFEYLCAGASTVARPYATQTSGATNYKYTGNFDGTGSIAISFPGATNPFTITKTVTPDALVAGTAQQVTYTITISNPSPHASRLTSIIDTLPAGVSFVALAAGSEVTLANSSAVPSNGATGTLTFFGIRDVSYMIPAGGSLVLRYTALVSGTPGTYVNTAYGSFGGATTPTASATTSVVDPLPLVVNKTSTLISDPVNGTVSPFHLPGGVVEYHIDVQNPGPFAANADSVVVVDPTAANLALVVADLAPAAGPVAFADGVAPSGLSYQFDGLASQTDRVDFSSDGGVTWAYVPVPDANGADAAVTHIRVRPTGTMAAGTSFALRLRYRVQ